MQNNTWKYIPLNYTVTTNTVIEFEFSSGTQGEIHGIGFENDDTLTQTQYFKVHGIQNYGVTNYDNYTSGTTTYVIPIGDFYTGVMDKLVLINDNDASSGNNSTFSNVKIYEGSCDGSLAKIVTSRFGGNIPIIGNEDVLSSIDVFPNPLNKGDVLKVFIPSKTVSETSYSILNGWRRKD